MRPKALIVFFIVLAAVPATAQTILERVERDELAIVSKNDPNMVAAMRKARDTLQDFLTLARAPRPSTSGFAVKVAIRDKNTENEYFWITPFKEQDGRFSGRIDNTPRWVKSVKFGQTFAFSEDEIVDWLYMDGGKMKGNFTVCAIMKREPSQAEVEAVKKRFGLECEF